MANEKKQTSQLVNKFNEMPPKKRAVILILVLVLIAGISTWKFFWPKWDEIKRLNVNLTNLNTELSAAKKNAMEIDKVKADVKAAEEEFATLVKALPETQEIPVLLASISKAGQEENLDFLLFEPQKEIPYDFYAEVPVKLEIVGDYHDIARFFSKLANFPRIVVIRNVEMKPYGAARVKVTSSKSGYNLMVSCIASTYIFLEADKSKPAAGGAASGGGGRFGGAGK